MTQDNQKPNRFNPANFLCDIADNVETFAEKINREQKIEAYKQRIHSRIEEDLLEDADCGDDYKQKLEVAKYFQDKKKAELAQPYLSVKKSPVW